MEIEFKVDENQTYSRSKLKQTLLKQMNAAAALMNDAAAPMNDARACDENRERRRRSWCSETRDTKTEN